MKDMLIEHNSDDEGAQTAYFLQVPLAILGGYFGGKLISWLGSKLMQNVGYSLISKYVAPKIGTAISKILKIGKYTRGFSRPGGRVGIRSAFQRRLASPSGKIAAAGLRKAAFRGVKTWDEATSEVIPVETEYFNAAYEVYDDGTVVLTTDMPILYDDAESIGNALQKAVQQLANQMGPLSEVAMDENVIMEYDMDDTGRTQTAYFLGSIFRAGKKLIGKTVGKIIRKLGVKLLKKVAPKLVINVLKEVLPGFAKRLKEKKEREEQAVLGLDFENPTVYDEEQPTEEWDIETELGPIKGKAYESGWLVIDYPFPVSKEDSIKIGEGLRDLSISKLRRMRKAQKRSAKRERAQNE